jgi:hypothetical protein
MALLDALFSGAKALLNEVIAAGRAVVREVLKEVDQSAFGRAATRLVDGVVDRYFTQARDLAGEEQELAAKAQRDRRRTEADADRLREIEAERERLRREMERAASARAAQEFRERADETLVAQLDDDELSSNVGILSAKQCPACGGTMRIRQRGLNVTTGMRNFYWQCTEPRVPSCPTLKLDPEQARSTVLRPADPDLDTPKEKRRETWTRSDVLAETHTRVRQHLGDDDNQLVCPHHLLPMKLLPKRNQSGLLLDSYEYVCLAVTPSGKACDHKIDLQTMPQVAAMLRRTEGTGIIRS